MVIFRLEELKLNDKFCSVIFGREENNSNFQPFFPSGKTNHYLLKPTKRLQAFTKSLIFVHT